MRVDYTSSTENKLRKDELKSTVYFQRKILNDLYLR